MKGQSSMTGMDIKPDAQGKVRDLYDLGAPAFRPQFWLENYKHAWERRVVLTFAEL